MAESEMISNHIDSSGDTEQFFEGVEKLLEIWFIPNKNTDLRKIPRQNWEQLLKIVGCEIISFTRSEQVDAYVLSESSMFVSRSRWILKTCGTTTPLKCIRGALELAGAVAVGASVGGGGEDVMLRSHSVDDTTRVSRAPSTAVDRVFYSRREFAKPDRQSPPHITFDAEVEMLATYFGDGSAYVLGPEKDCWYLYTSLPLEGTVSALMKQDKEEKLLSHLSRLSNGQYLMREMGALPEPDQTIEILMSELDPRIMDIFTKKVARDGADATKISGIDKLIPGMVIDDFLFEPCGYSMNGVMENRNLESAEGYYMTIHITPERNCSYVSFETNIPPEVVHGADSKSSGVGGYDTLIARVIDTFRPGKFVLTIFNTPDSEVTEPIPAGGVKKLWNSYNYIQKECQLCRFSGYQLHFALYCKFPS